MDFPHLTDVESVRREASQSYGGLSDAAAFQQAHRASQDPNVEAAALRHRDPEATAEVQADLSLAQAKIDKAHGQGTYRVLDAAVRGNALSVVVEDAYGRSKHLVVGWNDQWRSITRGPDDVAARANAEAEAAKGRLGAEARLEVERIVRKAQEEALAKAHELFGKKVGEVDKAREKAVADAEKEDDKGKQHADGSASGSKGGSKSGSDGGKYPSTHDDLDALADEHNVVFAEGTKTVQEKQDALKKAGVKPPEE